MSTSRVGLGRATDPRRWEESHPDLLLPTRTPYHLFTTGLTMGIQLVGCLSQHCKWRLEHPRYKTDPCYLLTRREQVTVFRLRAGHNRLNHHLYSKLRIGHTEQCPCDTGSQTTTSAAVLPPLRAAQKGNLARPHSRSPSCPTVARGTYDALPPSWRRLQLPSDEREEVGVCLSVRQ